VPSTYTIHDDDPSVHRPGTVSAQGRRAWGGACRRRAVYSIESEEEHADGWCGSCAEHVRGLHDNQPAAALRWAAPGPPVWER